MFIDLKRNIMYIKNRKEVDFMAKYLIINADDYGLCKSANDAVEELFRNGRLKSSTIMMPCPAAGDAMEFAKKCRFHFG